MGLGRAGTIVGLAALAVGGCAREPAGAPDADTRVVVSLRAPERDLVLIEMRTMLTSLQQAITASAVNDTAAIRRAAVEAGSRYAADLELREALPGEFVRLGMNTHQRFDSLAAAAQAGVPRDSLLARLGGIAQNCVACHATYRLVPRR